MNNRKSLKRIQMFHASSLADEVRCTIFSDILGGSWYPKTFFVYSTFNSFRETWCFYLNFSWLLEMIYFIYVQIILNEYFLDLDPSLNLHIFFYFSTLHIHDYTV